MKWKILLVAVVLLCLATPLLAQAPLNAKPGLAYRFTSPKEEGLDIQTSVVLEVPLHYLVPLTTDGEWNLQVVGGGGLGTDYGNSMFGLGAAYAPRDVPNIIVGVAVVADITWPDEDFTKRTLGLDDEAEIPDETWVTIGGELSLDFIVPPGFPGSIIAGAGYGIRGNPDAYYIAFQIPMNPNEPEERVRRFDD
jgi:hypothetical protein